METTPLTVTTSSPGQTLDLGRRLAALLEPGDVICLFGQLGAGKTCLVQGICLGLGAEEGAVSPSFTLVNEYFGRLPVFHFDCYRLDGPRDLDQIGYDDYLGRDGVALIEWAGRIGSRLPDERLDVRMERVSDDVRRITLEPRGPRWQGSGIEKMQA